LTDNSQIWHDSTREEGCISRGQQRPNRKGAGS